MTVEPDGIGKVQLCAPQRSLSKIERGVLAGTVASTFGTGLQPALLPPLTLAEPEPSAQSGPASPAWTTPPPASTR